MDNEKQELNDLMDKEKEIGVYIDRTYKAVRQDLIMRFKSSKVDLTPEQWAVVSKLNFDTEVTQKDLAEKSFKDKPTLSRIVDLLVKKEFVYRRTDDSDRRKVFLRLSSRGKEIVDKALPLVVASRSVGWRNLSNKEYEEMITTLDKIMNNYRSDW